MIVSLWDIVPPLKRKMGLTHAGQIYSQCNLTEIREITLEVQCLLHEFHIG